MRFDSCRTSLDKTGEIEKNRTTVKIVFAGLPAADSVERTLAILLTTYRIQAGGVCRTKYLLINVI